MLVDGDTFKRKVHSSSWILKLSRQPENNGFAKPCGEDIYRPLPFFLMPLCFPRKLRNQLPISQSASPVAGATGSEKISSKFPKESVVCLSLVSPQVPLIHTTFWVCLAPGACSARDVNPLVGPWEKRPTTSSLVAERTRERFFF